MSKLNLRSYPPSLKKNAWSQVRVNYSFSTCFEFSFPTILIPWSKHGLGRGRGWCRWMWVKMWVVGVEWNLLPDARENRRPLYSVEWSVWSETTDVSKFATQQNIDFLRWWRQFLLTGTFEGWVCRFTAWIDSVIPRVHRMWTRSTEVFAFILRSSMKAFNCNMFLRSF